MNGPSIHSPNKSEEDKRLQKRMQNLTSGGISSYPDFLKNAGNNYRTQQLIKKLNAFKAKIEDENSGIDDFDPICYLKRLYYIKGLSIGDVFEKVTKEGLTYSSPDSIQSLFIKTLGWELIGKDNPTRKLKDLREKWGNREKMEAHNQKLLEGNIEKFNNALNSILEKKDWINKQKFSRRKYESFTGKLSEIHNKAFYLLECYSNITFDDIVQASIDSGIGFRTIVRIINTKVKALQVMKDIDEDLTIKATTLGKRLRGEKKKKLANNSAHH